jgi:hypothetical protein
MAYEAMRWPKLGVVIPAEPGRFELYRMAYEVRVEETEEVVAVESYYVGPVIAWRVAQPGGDGTELITHPVTFGATSFVEYVKPVENDADESQWLYFWHDAKMERYFSAVGEMPRSLWTQRVQSVIELFFDRPDQKQARQGLPWLICEPPDGSFDMMLAESKVEAVRPQNAG